MPRPTPTDEDIWTGIQDPKKRKQIQDRLAQRARRKRLAALKAAGGAPGTSPTTSTPLARRARSSCRPSAVSTADASPAEVSTRSLVRLAHPLNIYSALWTNGAMLGLTCSTIWNVPSVDLGPSIPEPLQPTQRQLATSHPSWIDRYPFPVMRDNFIALLDVIDPEDFLFDMFNMPSFTIEPGAPSWDPSCWRIEPGFGHKWGFLFNPNLLDLASRSPSPRLIALEPETAGVTPSI